MKKRNMILTLFAVSLLCGCTKNYKTVDEYYSQMKKISSANSSYTLDLKTTQENKTVNTKVYSKSGKWKSVADLGVSNISKIYYLYDGEKILSYDDNSKIAIEVPINKLQDNQSLKEKINKNDDPAFTFINWHESMEQIKSMTNPEDTSIPKVPKEFVVKNGFDCRLIKYTDNIEACISDKYGIAVYERFKLDNKTAKMQNIEMTLDVTNINTDEIPDSELEVPSGKKIMSFDEFLGITKMR